MASTSIEKELIGLERQFWQAMKDHDVETAMKLTDFPCIVAGPQPRQEELVTLLARADVPIDEMDGWVLRLEPRALDRPFGAVTRELGDTIEMAVSTVETGVDAPTGNVDPQVGPTAPEIARA